MRTIIQVLIGQIEIFLIGFILLLLRKLITKDYRSLPEMLGDPALTNKYWLLFLAVVWFGGFTWFIYYYQLPAFGIWSYIFDFFSR